MIISYADNNVGQKLKSNSPRHWKSSFILKWNQTWCFHCPKHYECWKKWMKSR